MYEDACGGSTLPDDVRLGATGGEGTSEGGSESSSIAGSVSVRTSRMNVKRTASTSSAAKKKVTSGTESQKSARTKPTSAASSTSLSTTTPRSKSRTATPRNIMAKAQGASRERDHRPRSREKLSARESSSSLVADTTKMPVGSRGTTTYGCRSSSSMVATPTLSSVAKTRTRTLPDSLPSALTTEINKDLAQRGARVVRSDSSRSRTASSTRGARTPASTPSEETKVKLPSMSTARALCGKSAVSRADKAAPQDNKALDTYATLPRRNRSKLIISKVGEKMDKMARSRSGSRDVSLNRIVEKKTIGRDSSSVHKSLPPYPRQRTEKTRIYHEIGAQTGLTGQDIENAMSGQPNAIAGPEVIERLHEGCQTEIAWNDVQTLQDNLRRTNEESSSLREENERLKLELAKANRLLEEERADHAFARQELDRNAQRVLAMLGTPQSEHAGNSINNKMQTQMITLLIMQDYFILLSYLHNL